MTRWTVLSADGKAVGSVFAHDEDQACRMVVESRADRRGVASFVAARELGALKAVAA